MNTSFSNISRCMKLSPETGVDTNSSSAVCLRTANDSHILNESIQLDNAPMLMLAWIN